MAKLKIWSLTYLEARFPAPLMKWVGDRPLSIFFFVPSARWGTWLVFRLCAKPNCTNSSSSNTPSLLAAEDEHEFWLAGKNSGVAVLGSALITQHLYRPPLFGPTTPSPLAASQTPLHHCYRHHQELHQHIFKSYQFKDFLIVSRKRFQANNVLLI